MRFDPHRRARGVEAPDLTGQVVGLCVVESKAPSVTTSQRWRVRCNAITPERDQCGNLFYLETPLVRIYQKPEHALFTCKECRARKRQARMFVRFTCEGCGYPVEMLRRQVRKRSPLTRGLCPNCAVKAGRTHAQGTRITRRAERRAHG